MITSQKPVLLYSGGVDSLCIYSILKTHKHNIQPVYISNDMPYAVQEVQVIKEQMKQGLIETVYFSPLPLIYARTADKNSGFVPLRNLLLAALPVMQGANTVYMGALKGEGSRDKSEKFFKDTSKLFSYLLNRDIIVTAPFRHLTKAQLVRKALETGLRPENFKYTVSCYEAHTTRARADSVGCGTCTACFRRWIAMERNNIHERYDIVGMRNYWQEQYSWKNRSLLFEQPLRRWPELFINNIEALRVLWSR